MTPRGLPYYGGKSPERSTSKWIASLLPKDTRVAYIEPFCGMCGVLMLRKRAKVEIINDINDRLINWWIMTRDHPEEFGSMLEKTQQISQTGFDLASQELDCKDPIRRAVAYTVVIMGSLIHSDSDKQAHYAPEFSVESGTRAVWRQADIDRLRDRTRYVQILNRDAVNLLERVKNDTDAVIYCDPPYESSDNRGYRDTPDWQNLKDVLAGQKGRVAISGFNDDFDSLGWHCEARKRHTTRWNCMSREAKVLDRTEKLWMNYDPPQKGLF